MHPRLGFYLLAATALVTGCGSGTSGPSNGGPGGPSGDPIVTQSCQELGLEIGSSDLGIGAGQAGIGLPSRSSTVAIGTPGILDQADTEYVLTGDTAAPGTAFEIAASNITLNLSGHTVTYGTADSPTGESYGVFVASNVTGVVIANGRIEQGNGACTGSGSGTGCNPILVESGVDEIGGLHLSWHTDDTSGIVSNFIPAEIHHNTLIDGGTVVSNRHQGVPAIRAGRAAARVHHNLLRGVRHRGIDLGSGGEAAYNEIHINSYDTNSFGVFVFVAQGFSIHHNKIYGVGTNPIGIGVIGDTTRGPSTNGEVYSNYIEVENTRDSTEYASTSGAACFRTTWGADDVEIMCNHFYLVGGNSHPELTQGHGWYGDRSWGRCLWVGLTDAAQTMVFHDNIIDTINSDGSTYVPAVGVIYGPQSDNLVVQENTIRTNNIAVSLSDHYGGSSGYPKFVRNRFERLDAYPTYRTIASLYQDMTATAMFVDNLFGAGTELSEDTVELRFCGSGIAEVILATVQNDAYVQRSALTDVRETIDSGVSSEAFDPCGFDVTF